jgi:tRNA pseudouridine38-40 synthase
LLAHHRNIAAVGEATYRAVIEYDGTDFCGFQFQPELRTIAGELEKTLSRLFAMPIKVTCAGRTDAGVHASGQVISFTSHDAFPIGRLAIALNSALPRDLTARDATIVERSFSARFDAIERRYVYRVLNRPHPSAVSRRFVHHEYRPIDDDRMRAAAAHLVGEHDFLTFCGVFPESGTTVREIAEIAIERAGERLDFHIRGKSFLHRMVRIVVGTLLDVGAGKTQPYDVAEMLAARDRRVAGPTAPAHGLTLASVIYPDWSSASPHAARVLTERGPE